jgi:DNA-binding MurR/RpiR family transcriptional regulator
VKKIEALRRQRWTGQQIAKEAGVSAATVSRVLSRLGLSRMKDLEPAEPIRRYERQHRTDPYREEWGRASGVRRSFRRPQPR